ncbi:MAG: hypothetical protein HGB00_08355 [Chlorobiaceae bacterium]|nr:hypothetical protein [Chlorobiaceae bacterium]
MTGRHEARNGARLNLADLPTRFPFRLYGNSWSAAARLGSKADGRGKWSGMD